ncbi:MAG: hypothetical protein M5R42_13705 [Rhodocyclaceae bacterium]|nr:hypothetical protein [Rhodocyclaceae bacterium]
MEEVGLAEIRGFQARLAEFGPFCIAAAEVRFIEARLAEVGILQLGAGEARAAQVLPASLAPDKSQADRSVRTAGRLQSPTGNSAASAAAATIASIAIRQVLFIAPSASSAFPTS